MFVRRGKLPPKTVLKFLRECNPPVGWGKLCPELLAYKVQTRMLYLYTNYS